VNKFFGKRTARALPIQRVWGCDSEQLQDCWRDIDRLDLTQRTATDVRTSGIPAPGLSAHSMDRDRKKAVEAGFDDFDTKPLNLPRLIKKISKLLAKASS
jgi:CheY-like chemotaxis protein